MDSRKSNRSAGNKGKGEKRTKKNVRKRLITITLIVTAIIVIGGLAIMFPIMIEGTPKSAEIKIPEKATAEMVSDSLTKYFGKSYSDKVMRMAKLSCANFSGRYGAYQIPEGTSAFKGMIILCRRNQTPRKFTINHQRSLQAIAEIAAQKINCTPEQFKRAATDSAFLAKYNLSADDVLALFLDQTYEIYWSSTPEKLLSKIGDNYNLFWDQNRMEKAAALNLTPVEVTIIASITDEESNKSDEKGTIGRLYINRLQKGMKLQSDPTVRFALNDFTIKRVTSKHLGFDSPFNTYLYKGLPPGPICTTSEKTIESILDSEPSEYLYMCARADFSGYHEFAVDYADHVRNALNYQHELDRRGIH